MIVDQASINLKMVKGDGSRLLKKIIKHIDDMGGYKQYITDYYKYNRRDFELPYVLELMNYNG